MDSSVSPKDEIWFLRVCHHISTGLYHLSIFSMHFSRCPCESNGQLTGQTELHKWAICSLPILHFMAVVGPLKIHILSWTVVSLFIPLYSGAMIRSCRKQREETRQVRTRSAGGGPAGLQTPPKNRNWKKKTPINYTRLYQTFDPIYPPAEVSHWNRLMPGTVEFLVK